VVGDGREVGRRSKDDAGRSYRGGWELDRIRSSRSPPCLGHRSRV